MKDKSNKKNVRVKNKKKYNCKNKKKQQNDAF